MTSAAIECRLADRRSSAQAAAHYRGQLDSQRLAILLPAVRRAVLDLAQRTPFGLRPGSAHDELLGALELSDSLAQIGGAA